MIHLCSKCSKWLVPLILSRQIRTLSTHNDWIIWNQNWSTAKACGESDGLVGGTKTGNKGGFADGCSSPWLAFVFGFFARCCSIWGCFSWLWFMKMKKFKRPLIQCQCQLQGTELYSSDYYEKLSSQPRWPVYQFTRKEEMMIIFFFSERRSSLKTVED